MARAQRSSEFHAELVGGKELERALMQLPKRIAKAAIKRALKKAGTPIAEHAQELAPVLYGDLQRRIRVSATLSRRQRRHSRKSGEPTIYIGAGPSREAHLVEFGTGPRQHRSGKSTGQMPAIPFMRPAWDAGHKPALKAFGPLLWREIEKAAKRLARRQARGTAGRRR